MDKQSRQQLGIVAAIARERKKARYSQRELSVRAGKYSTFLQKVESYTIEASGSDLIDIGNALGIDPCELLRGGMGGQKLAKQKDQ